jgi:hypothetical protein
LIFSYIGFLTIIKEIIIKAKLPSAFLEKEWEDLISKINNDELWEKEVFEALIRTNKPIFPLNEDLKLQLRYWKDRRNDCAHFKRNEIESHHTEAFWSFIKSNIPKMTVEGGMETLLNKFDEHFDDTRTSPTADFTHLVKEIENSVLTSELNDFFGKLDSICFEHRWYYPEPEEYRVFCKILDVADTRTQEVLIEYLKQGNRCVNFLNFHPDKILRLNFSSSDIRKMWKSRFYDKTANVNPFNIFAELLRHNLIPKDQIEEANRELFNHFNQGNFYRLPESKDFEILKVNGFFETVYKIAIEEKNLDDFKWVNSKCDLIITFIKNQPLNVNTVRCVFEMADRQMPSEWLIKALNKVFSKFPDLKTQFHSIATSNNIKIPIDFK